MQNSTRAACENGAMPTFYMETLATAFNAMQGNLGIMEKGVKGTNGVGTATNTSDHSIGEFAVGGIMKLLFDFLAHGALKVTNNCWERMRGNS